MFNDNNQNNLNNSNSDSNSKEEQYSYEEKPQKTKEQIDVETGQTRALIAYLGPFVLIPYFQEKENPFVLYHVKQGMNLFILEVITVVIVEIVKILLLTIAFWLASVIDFVIGFIIIGLSLVGIYYVLEGKMQELPIVGSIKFIK